MSVWKRYTRSMCKFCLTTLVFIRIAFICKRYISAATLLIKFVICYFRKIKLWELGGRDGPHTIRRTLTTFISDSTASKFTWTGAVHGTSRIYTYECYITWVQKFKYFTLKLYDHKKGNCCCFIKSTEFRTHLKNCLPTLYLQLNLKFGCNVAIIPVFILTLNLLKFFSYFRNRW